MSESVFQKPSPKDTIAANAGMILQQRFAAIKITIAPARISEAAILCSLLTRLVNFAVYPYKRTAISDSGQEGRIDCSLSAILTRAAKESASIFRIICPR